MSETERLKIVFMGTPDFAAPCLRSLHNAHDVVMVVTQPDRRRGRGRQMANSPIKNVALELGLPVIQPESLRRRAVRQELEALGADFFVVVAFGQILRPKMLAVPRRGCLNVHASLLPRHRGAAPIQWAVLDGDHQSGVSIMQLDAGIDTGPVILRRAVVLAADETAGSLHDKLAPLGGQLLMQAIEGLLDGALHPVAQDDGESTIARMLEKDDGLVDFSRPAIEVDRWIRGLDPWPGAFAWLGDARLSLGQSMLGEGSGAPGEVLSIDRRGMLLACGADAVWVRSMQLPGRRMMHPQALVAGHPIPRSTILRGR